MTILVDIGHMVSETVEKIDQMHNWLDEYDGPKSLSEGNQRIYVPLWNTGFSEKMGYNYIPSFWCESRGNRYKWHLLSWRIPGTGLMRYMLEFKTSEQVSFFILTFGGVVLYDDSN